MQIKYALLDVFADSKFQGTQIPVVMLDSMVPETTKLALAGEFNQTETVFVDPEKSPNRFSVYNAKEKTVFGAHTTLAASYMAQELGMTTEVNDYDSVILQDAVNTIECYIDKVADTKGEVQFKRSVAATIDRYTPASNKIAEALNIAEKHITFSKYKPLLVCVDHPVLVVPLTKPEHVLSAQLNTHKWAELMSEVYASDLLLIAPGSISGLSDFHGRILNPYIAQDEYPPIGKVITEFIGYLVHQDSIVEGTHIFSIDRGSLETRKSVLNVEFDKLHDKLTQCRIGGSVIKMGEGCLYFN